jgi:predicted DCC family thiol-disulfide oxidoreductase YuxK
VARLTGQWRRGESQPVDTGGVTEAVFVFDGDCAFCSACARFLQRRVPTAARIDPWQFTDLARLGLTVAECDAAVQWVPGVPRHGAAKIEAGPAAIAALLRTSRWYWRVAGRVLGARPVLALAWPVYRWVARNRDRMPGGTAACAVPAAQRPGGTAHSSPTVP